MSSLACFKKSASLSTAPRRRKKACPLFFFSLSERYADPVGRNSSAVFLLSKTQTVKRKERTILPRSFERMEKKKGKRTVLCPLGVIHLSLPLLFPLLCAPVALGDLYARESWATDSIESLDVPSVYIVVIHSGRPRRSKGKKRALGLGDNEKKGKRAIEKAKRERERERKNQ